MFRFSLLFFLLILCGGCWERKPNPPPTDVPAPTPIPTSVEQTPQQILEKMVAVYQSATSYADHGEVRIVGKLTQPESEPIAWPCTVAFRAPGNLRLEVNEGILVSDGVDVFAQVRRLFGQVLKFPAPEKWTLDVLFKDVYLDEAMNLVFPKDIVAFPPQVVLLFADDPLKTFLPEGAVAELLAPQPVNGRPCDCVQITHRDKKRIFRIDRETGALRRLDYLVEGLPLPPGVESVRLIQIDMSDAAFNVAISPEAFEMEQPVDALQVDEFRPTESTLLGQTIKNPGKIVLNRFPLKEADEAESVALKDLAGKTVVFCFWTTWSEHSRGALAEMQKSKETLSTNEQVRFFTVNLDTPPNESEIRPMIEKALSDWSLSIAVDRPTDFGPLDELGIDSFPTLLIVGPDGCVEFFFRGIVPAAILGKIVHDIQSGGKPHKEGLDLFEQEKTEYHKMLGSMVKSGCFALFPPQTDRSPLQVVAPRRLPSSLKLTQRWTIKTLKSPGNVVELPGPAGAPPSLLLPCEGNFLAIIDLDGKAVKKEKPVGLQNDELLNIVRIGIDDIGKRYIGVSAIGGRSIHVLDAALETFFSWTPSKQEEVVADFQLVDLRKNNKPVLLLGLLSLDDVDPTATDSLRAVEFQGQELWRDEAISSPFQVKTFSKEGRLEVLAIHGGQRQGSILRFGTEGGQLGELVIEGDQQIRWFQCAGLNSNDNSEIVAILVSPTNGDTQVAGIGEAGKILWSVPLPSGEHSTPIEPIVVGDINGDGIREWIVPAADGSILFIDRNGKLIDTFATGLSLSGVAVLSWENCRLLVVADAETVTAWDIE